MDDTADLAIDPSEVRATPAPRPRRSRPVRTAVIAGLGAACLAAGAGAAVYLTRTGEPQAARLSAIKIGPVADMPEIKDGVPAIMDRAAMRVISTTPPDKPLPGAATGAAAVPPPTRATPSRPTEVRIGAPDVPAPVVLATDPKAARPSPVQTSALSPPADRPAPTATIEHPPLPPAAPERGGVRRPEPAAPRVATLPRPRPATPAAASPPAAQQASATAPSPAAAPEPDRVEVFGVKLPLVPTGRQIREAAESFADTITSLPGRL